MTRKRNKLLRVFIRQPKVFPLSFLSVIEVTAPVASVLQSPKLVLPAKWSYLWITSTQLQVNGSEPIEANWMLTQTAGARRLVALLVPVRKSDFYRGALL